jgi:hypothetical protein
MKCIDGAVIAADRQMTKDGGLKYQEKKFITGRVIGDIPLEYAVVYSGIPEAARTVVNEIGRSLLANVCNGNVFMPSMVVEALRQVFKSKDSKDLETLIILGAPGIEPFILRTKESRVVLGRMECIGVGDSSVIHYFAELLPKNLTVSQAKPIAAYLVSLGNRFIDGCGFGPDVLFIGKEGTAEVVTEEEKSAYAQKFPGLEGIVSSELAKWN